MAGAWYYVEGSERVGPVDDSVLESLFNDGVIGPDSYVWQKGFDNWKLLKTVDELNYLGKSSQGGDSPSPEENSSQEEKLERGEEGGVSQKEDPQRGQNLETQGKSRDEEFLGDEDELERAEREEEEDDFLKDLPDRIYGIDFSALDEKEKIFTIKVGLDRGGVESEYGPFSLVQLKRAYEENRINGKTYIFTPGMENWTFLGDFELFKEISGEEPPKISSDERRKNPRKPFIARMLFHDNKEVFEGICRDISIGGLQVLVADFPGGVGEEVAMNVHPDNSDHCFTASGTIVRKLEGDSGFSLRFGELSKSAIKSISSYIMRQV